MFSFLDKLEVLTASDIRNLYPDTSFPLDMNKECLEEFGIVPIEFDPAPPLAPDENIEPGELRREGNKVIRAWNIIHDPIPAPTSEDVNAERDRRIDAGVIFEGVLYQSAIGDRENIAGSSQIAFMAILNGAERGDLRWADPNNDFYWIAADNSYVYMDAYQVVEFGKTVAAHKQAHIYACSNIKNMDPIPLDYRSDVYWPANEH